MTEATSHECIDSKMLDNLIISSIIFQEKSRLGSFIFYGFSDVGDPSSGLPSSILILNLF